MAASLQRPGEAVVRGNAGIVMDVLVFDPLGILLLSVPEVRRLSRRAGMILWPSQASLIVPSGRLENNGQSLVFKVPLSRRAKTATPPPGGRRRRGP